MRPVEGEDRDGVVTCTVSGFKTFQDFLEEPVALEHSGGFWDRKS